jgi:hypothetical protein
MPTLLMEGWLTTLKLYVTEKTEKRRYQRTSPFPHIFIEMHAESYF